MAAQEVERDLSERADEGKGPYPPLREPVVERQEHALERDPLRSSAVGQGLPGHGWELHRLMNFTETCVIDRGRGISIAQIGGSR